MTKKKTVKRKRSIRNLSEFEWQFIALLRVFKNLSLEDTPAAECALRVMALTSGKEKVKS